MKSICIAYRIITYCVLLVLIPFTVQARGSREQSGEYEEALIEIFEPLLEKVDSSQLNPEDAKAKLQELREQFNRNYNDVSGILDSLIDGVHEHRISKEDAVIRFSRIMQNNEKEEKPQTNPADSSLNNSKNGQNGGRSGTRSGSSGSGGRNGKR